VDAIVIAKHASVRDESEGRQVFLWNPGANKYAKSGDVYVVAIALRSLATL